MIRSAAALIRLGLVLALTTLYLVAQGTEVVKQGKRRWVDVYWFRGIVVLPIGGLWLEAAHHLVAAGYEVETEPGALLAAEDEPWRARAGPDLAFTLRGEVWPTEVQREVSPRVVAKWAKSLELCGRLALVL